MRATRAIRNGRGWYSKLASDCTITSPLRTKNTSTPAPPCWNIQCNQCGSGANGSEWLSMT